MLWKVFWWKGFVGYAIFDILEPPAFQKYSIHCVLEALCICIFGGKFGKTRHIWYPWTPSLEKYCIHWVLEALCIWLCLCQCLCNVYLCLCFFVCICLGHCHHQMIGFQKIYGFNGQEQHIMDIVELWILLFGISLGETWCSN